MSSVPFWIYTSALICATEDMEEGVGGRGEAPPRTDSTRERDTIAHVSPPKTPSSSTPDDTEGDRWHQAPAVIGPLRGLQQTPHILSPFLCHLVRPVWNLTEVGPTR